MILLRSYLKDVRRPAGHLPNEKHANIMNIETFYSKIRFKFLSIVSSERYLAICIFVNGNNYEQLNITWFWALYCHFSIFWCLFQHQIKECPFYLNHDMLHGKESFYKFQLLNFNSYSYIHLDLVIFLSLFSISLCTCLLSIWTSQQFPTINFSFGYVVSLFNLFSSCSILRMSKKVIFHSNKIKVCYS